MNGTARAAQIGVVSRGYGCAGFNSPAVFGSVKMSYDWIEKTVKDEMKDEGYCDKPEDKAEPFDRGISLYKSPENDTAKSNNYQNQPIQAQIEEKVEEKKISRVYRSQRSKPTRSKRNKRNKKKRRKKNKYHKG